MYRVTYVLGTLDPIERAQATAKIQRALVRMDVDYLRAHPETPLLSKAGMKRVSEPRDHDEWHDVPALLARKTGTAPELRCWHAAEDHVRRGAPLTVPGLSTIDDEQGRFILTTGLFDGEEERQLSHRALAHMLVALTCIDALQLARHPELPDLYESGVRYQEEPYGQEDWQDAPTTIAMGFGDCEDLACWRAAELNVRHGIKAFPTFLWRVRPSGSYLYHIQTKYPDGSIEDPSRALGMR